MYNIGDGDRNDGGVSRNVGCNHIQFSKKMRSGQLAAIHQPRAVFHMINSLQKTLSFLAAAIEVAVSAIRTS
jgi:hypothetical protein